MAAKPARYGITNPAEPSLRELPPLKHEGDLIPLRILYWRCEDGTWRARLVFGDGEIEQCLTTAEIFCAPTEDDLWAAVGDLRTYHVADLYRSLAE